jgi:hypothetical protein
LHLHHKQLITSQQTISEAAKEIFIQGFISIDILKHAWLFQNILGIPRMIKKQGNFGKSRAWLENGRLFLQTTKLDQPRKSRAFSKQALLFPKKAWLFRLKLRALVVSKEGRVCAGRGQPLGQEDGRGQLLSLPGSERRG